MLLFGLALVLMMLFRPAGILPSAVRKRELETQAHVERAAAPQGAIAPGAARRRA